MKVSTNYLGGLAVAVAMFSGSSAMAEVKASDANVLMEVMQGFGYLATMEVDNVGDPKIASRVSDTKFKVYFYGCTDNLNCDSIQFVAGYNLSSGINALKVNEWNREKRFAKAYIDDEGDPFLEFDVNMAFDGVGEKNFENTLDRWRSLVEDFEDFIEW